MPSLRHALLEILTVSALGSAMTCGVAAQELIPIWPDVAPGEAGDSDAETQLPMRPGDNTIRITNVTRPTLEAFLPPRAKRSGAAVLICPGGGYKHLTYNKEGTEVAAWLNSLGVAGLVLKYRVPARKDRARFEAPLQDAQRALGLVRQRARSWDLDPDRLGVLGFSAGGHVAAALSHQSARRTYPRQDGADEVSCRPNFALLIYPAYLIEREGGHTLAPEVQVTSATPPTFLVQAEDDSVGVECSLFYYLALKKAKVPGEMHLYPDGGHGYGLRPSPHTVSTWPGRAEQWLRALGVLEPKSP